MTIKTKDFFEVDNNLDQKMSFRKTKTKPTSIPSPQGTRPKSALVVPTQLEVATMTEETKKKKKKTITTKQRTSSLATVSADKIKSLTQELIRIRQERKKLFPTYEPPHRPSSAHKPKDILNVEHQAHRMMGVDMDVVHVAAAHSPYLVRPECGYTHKVLNTTLDLRETLGNNSGKRLKDVEDLPFDIATCKDVHEREVLNFRAKYRVSG